MGILSKSHQSVVVWNPHQSPLPTNAAKLEWTVGRKQQLPAFCLCTVDSAPGKPPPTTSIPRQHWHSLSPHRQEWLLWDLPYWSPWTCIVDLDWMLVTNLNRLGLREVEVPTLSRGGLFACCSCLCCCSCSSEGAAVWRFVPFLGYTI